MISRCGSVLRPASLPAIFSATALPASFCFRRHECLHQSLVELVISQCPRRNQGRSITYPSRESDTRTSSPTLSFPKHAVQQFIRAVTSSPRSSLTLTVITGRTTGPMQHSSAAVITPRNPRRARKISAPTKTQMRNRRVMFSIVMVFCSLGSGHRRLKTGKSNHKDTKTRRKESKQSTDYADGHRLRNKKLVFGVFSSV